MPIRTLAVVATGALVEASPKKKLVWPAQMGGNGSPGAGKELADRWLTAVASRIFPPDGPAPQPLTHSCGRQHYRPNSRWARADPRRLLNGPSTPAGQFAQMTALPPAARLANAGAAKWPTAA